MSPPCCLPASIAPSMWPLSKSVLAANVGTLASAVSAPTGSPAAGVLEDRLKNCAQQF
eukprot:CAMPEP_0170638814 /NCGR_PEP_ID=MMETSP0224-20130122/39282_1 /TAXON_ID=285029 /ORGANISM="Togula jolla, Strain CCCM 725" /LENGTH=57 /DNA_ID=CAMNT_0010969059 /DNA_START=347 /DNA_END=517 /DNA_ORIENTATION=-